MASLTSAGINFGDGTTQNTAAAASSYIGGRGQVFTGSGTFTVPAGVTSLKVTVVGGGGNGGSAQSLDQGEVGMSGGGGGGGAAIKYITGLAPGTGIAVTVGGAGGTSSFGSYCSATGGAAGGFGGSARHTRPSRVQGGIGSGGDMNIPGTWTDAAVYVGGPSILHPSGGGVYNQVGQFRGAGGGGVQVGTTWASAGGAAGAAGIVIVEW